MADVFDVANYILAKADSEDELISNLKLQKLVYYAQGLHLALYGKPLFDARIERWMHGPVVRELYNKYASQGSSALDAPQRVADPALTVAEREVIDEVYSVYGQFSAWKLRDLTHSESPWIDAQSDFNEITLDSMQDYFTSRLK